MRFAENQMCRVVIEFLVKMLALIEIHNAIVCKEMFLLLKWWFLCGRASSEHGTRSEHPKMVTTKNAIYKFSYTV